jgi:hypothetical protein
MGRRKISCLDRESNPDSSVVQPVIRVHMRNTYGLKNNRVGVGGLEA